MNDNNSIKKILIPLSAILLILIIIIFLGKGFKPKSKEPTQNSTTSVTSEATEDTNDTKETTKETTTKEVKLTQFKIKVKDFKPEDATPFITKYQKSIDEPYSHAFARIVSYKDDILTLETPLNPEKDTINLAFPAITSDPEHRTFSFEGKEKADVTKEVIELKSLTDEEIENSDKDGSFYFSRMKEILDTACLKYQEETKSIELPDVNELNDILRKLSNYVEGLVKYY